MPIAVIAAVLVPYLLKVAIDDHIVPAVGTTVSVAELGPLWMILGGALGLVVGGYLAEGVYVASLQHGGQQLISDLREACYARTLRFPRTYYDKHPLGSVLTRVTSDIEALGEALATNVLSLFIDSLKTLAYLGFMLALNWKLTVVLLATFPLLILLIRIFQRLIRTSFFRSRQALSEATGYLQEGLSGVKTIQLFAAERTAYQRFERLNRRFLRAQNASNLYDALLFALVEWFSTLAIALLLWYSASSLLAGVISLGLLVAFMEYIQRLFIPVREFSQQIAVLQRAAGALDHIGELFQTPIDPRERPPSLSEAAPEATSGASAPEQASPATVTSEIDTSEMDAPEMDAPEMSASGMAASGAVPLTPAVQETSSPRASEASASEQASPATVRSEMGTSEMGTSEMDAPEMSASGMAASGAVPLTPAVQATSSPRASLRVAEHTPLLVFDRVWFRYRPRDPDVLRGISFTLEQGQTLALVGATGSGKSSVVRLLTRSYGDYRGHIRLKGVEIAALDADALARSISVVHQDVFLFEDTLEFNIALARQQITAAAVRQAARYVSAEAFIEKLEGGYQHPLQQGGTNLSAGQAQLIAFARAVAAQSELIVLDEATSAIDSVTEKWIQRAVQRIYADRTVIAIAHRLSTIRHADQILVLDQGQILERGTHEVLLAADGAYAHLVRMGSRPEAESVTDHRQLALLPNEASS